MTFIVLGGKHPVWATLGDISLEGCYVETVTPAPLNSYVTISFEAGGYVFQARGEVAPDIHVVTFVPDGAGDAAPASGLLPSTAAMARVNFEFRTSRGGTPYSCEKEV